MRTKAIPAEIVDTVKAHPAISIGVAVLAAFLAYGYYANQQDAAAANSANASYDTSGAYGSYMSYSAPLVYTPYTTATDSSGGSTSSGSVSLDVVSQSDLLDFEKLKEQHSYDLQLATLKQQADIAAANSTLQLAGINSANYQAASALAQTFMLSGNDLGGGLVTGPGGTQLVYSFTNHQVDPTTYGQATTRWENNIRGEAIQNFLNQAAKSAANVTNTIGVQGNVPLVTASSTNGTSTASGSATA